MVWIWVWTMVWRWSEQNGFGLKGLIRDPLCLESLIRGNLSLESLIRVNFRQESLIRDKFNLENLIRPKIWVWTSNWDLARFWQENHLWNNLKPWYDCEYCTATLILCDLDYFKRFKDLNVLARRTRAQKGTSVRDKIRLNYDFPILTQLPRPR